MFPVIISSCTWCLSPNSFALKSDAYSLAHLFSLIFTFLLLCTCKKLIWSGCLMLCTCKKLIWSSCLMHHLLCACVYVCMYVYIYIYNFHWIPRSISIQFWECLFKFHFIFISPYFVSFTVAMILDLFLFLIHVIFLVCRR